MFRHPSSPSPAPASSPLTVAEKIGQAPPAPAGPPEANSTPLKELMEKNLKWSQIIYEQNRKINSKLLWSAVAGWLRVLILLAPFIAAIIFLPPLWRNFKARYGNWLNLAVPAAPTSTSQPSTSLESLFNVLPLSPAQKEQLKAMLK